MKFKIWEEYGALNSRPVFSAFKESVKSAGHVILDSVRTVDDADIHVIWSVLFHGRMSRNKDIWKSCIRKNKPIIVLEVGGQTYHLTINKYLLL